MGKKGGNNKQMSEEGDEMPDDDDFSRSEDDILADMADAEIRNISGNVPDLTPEDVLEETRKA